MCTATQVRSLGPSQLAQGAMPALAAALRVALLGRLALASAVPIGHDGLAAAANLAPQACWSAPSGERALGGLLHPGNVPSTQRAIIYTKLAQQVYSTWNAFLSGGVAAEFLVRNCFRLKHDQDMNF